MQKCFAPTARHTYTYIHQTTKLNPLRCLEATRDRHRAANNSAASLFLQGVLLAQTQIFVRQFIDYIYTYVCRHLCVIIMYNFCSSAYHCSVLRSFKFICARNDIFCLSWSSNVKTCFNLLLITVGVCFDYFVFYFSHRCECLIFYNIYYLLLFLCIPCYMGGKAPWRQKRVQLEGSLVTQNKENSWWF